MKLFTNHKTLISIAILLLSLVVIYYLVNQLLPTKDVKNDKIQTTEIKTIHKEVATQHPPTLTQKNLRLTTLSPSKNNSSAQNNQLLKPIEDYDSLAFESNDSDNLYQQIEKKVDDMSHSELIDHISSLTNFTRDELSSFSDLHNFAKKLIKLADVSKKDEPNYYPAMYGSILFSTTNVWKMGENKSTVNFPAHTTKVFAILPKIENIEGAVFVRWYKNDSKKPLLFYRYTTDKEVSRNHIWIENMDGWAPGSYKVDVYSSNEYLDYLATGSYTIWEN